MKERNSEDNSIRSVHRALKLIDCLAGMEDGASIRELSRQLDLPRSSIQRLLLCLETEGLVHQRSDRGSYRLSAGIYRLVARIQSRLDLRQQALPVLRQARNLTKQTVVLLVREGNFRLCIESVDGLEPLRGFVGLGDRLPLCCGSSGKLMLAELPEEEIDRTLEAAGLAALTPNTITDPVQLKRELASIRQLGYAVSHQERYLGLHSVATPVRDYSGALVAALSIAGSEGPFTGTSMDLMILAAREAAAEISDRMGYQGASGG